MGKIVLCISSAKEVLSKILFNDQRHDTNLVNHMKNIPTSFKNFVVFLAVGMVCSVALPGCRTTQPATPQTTVGTEEQAPASPLTAIQKLYDQGQYEEALIACVDISRIAPETPGLFELRTSVMLAIQDKKTREAQIRTDLASEKMQSETIEKDDIPDTYGMKKQVEGETGTHRRDSGLMADALAKPVSMHLKGVSLSAIIGALAKDTQINIIADQGVSSNQVLDVELDNVPLQDMLDYIERNSGVRFYYGSNIVWVTKPVEQGGSAPLETRLYRLRHGLQFHGIDWLTETDRAKIYDKGGSVPLLTGKATDLASATNSVEAILQRFIPVLPGSDLYLDPNSHLLIARNTPDNLRQLESIIDALDIAPPQVLIEARFVETTVSDLRELGIDWMLNSTMDNGGGTIAAGSSVSYTPYASDDIGTVGLGPVGSFGEVRSGNPSTADQGLNLTYSGVLNDTMFSAVLHALDISGNGRTLSVPRVTTVNNNPAKLRNGEDLQYFDQFVAQAFSLLNKDNQTYSVTVLVPNGKPQVEELGITLIAVPSVGSDMKTINLLLMPTISSLDSWSYYQQVDSTNAVNNNSVQQVVAKLPIFSRKEIQTKVIVESGETVVLGGLIDTVKQETVHEVPILGKIPILGALFRRLDVTEQRRNLLVFVTATVISQRGENLVAR
jgi:type IV pilus assembly protein PilQ